MVLKIKKSDGIIKKRNRTVSFDLPLARFVQKNKTKSVLFSSEGKTSVFYTAQSKLYLTHDDLIKIRKGEMLQDEIKRIDSVFSPYFQSIHFRPSSYIYSRKESINYNKIRERYTNFSQYFRDLITNSVQGVSMVRMWNLSIVSSLIFGMFLMTMIYRYLGQGVSAGQVTVINNPSYARVLAAEDNKEGEKDKEIEEQIAKQILEEHDKIREEAQKDTFEGKIRQMTKDYPIEKMASDIARQDKIVAAFLVGIAKKESDWGKRVPVLDGQDCYNYWGFRAQRKRMGTGGHTCFDSRSDAVASVSKRIRDIIEKEKIKTPQGMVTVWKCGYDCSWDSKAAVRKWVKDVDGYFDEVNELKK